MIKTIKVKKQLNLHELIKHVWDNTLSGVYYKSDCQTFELRFDAFGRLGEVKGLLRNIEKQNTFTVEVEEEITKDTNFSGVQEVFEFIPDQTLETEMHPQTELKSIKDVLDEHDEETECLQIYAKVNGKLQLIWEAE